MNEKRPDEPSGIHEEDAAQAPEAPSRRPAEDTATGQAADPGSTSQSPEAEPAPDPRPPLGFGEGDTERASGADGSGPAESSSAPRRSGGFLAFLALLIALAAAAGAGYLWWSQQQEGAAENAALGELREAASRNQRQLSALQERLEDRMGALDAAVEERRGALDTLERGLDSVEDEVARAQERLARLADTGQPAERSPSLADAEYLLMVASRELGLADNHRVALAALREADQRLRQLGDPSLLPVRQAISDDIAAVEAAADADTDGLAMRLGSLTDRVQGLPLKASLAPEPSGAGGEGATAPSGWQRFKQRLADVASGLFRIRRMDAPPAPLLSPEESFFLYRNLELDLKTARLAAMENDQDNYQRSLDSARRAVEAFFLADDPAVQSFLSALDDLRTADVAPPEWPDIAETLELLRSVSETPGDA